MNLLKVLPSGFRIKQSWVLGDMAVFISSHLRQCVICFENGQSFAEKLECLGLKKLAEKKVFIWPWIHF